MGCFEPPILRISWRVWIRIGYVDLATGLLPGSHVSIPGFLVKHPNSCYTRTLHVPWCCLCFLCKRIGNQRYIDIFCFFSYMYSSGTFDEFSWYIYINLNVGFNYFWNFSPPEKKKGGRWTFPILTLRIFFFRRGLKLQVQPTTERGVIQCLYLDPMGVQSSPTESSHGAAEKPRFFQAWDLWRWVDLPANPRGDIRGVNFFHDQRL